MHLWTAQLCIIFLFNFYNYSTATPAEGEYAPTFFGRIGNWFKNLKDRIVGFFSGSQPPPAPQGDHETITHSTNVDFDSDRDFGFRAGNWNVIGKNPDSSWDNGMNSNSPSFNEKPPENDAEKKTFDISTTIESVINLSSEKPIEENTEVKKTNISTSKNPQSAEVVEP